MQINWVAGLGVLAFSSLACSATAEIGLQQENWLERSQKAFVNYSFQGTFVYERKGVFSTHKVLHKLQGEGFVQRIYRLDAEPYEIVRDQAECVKTHPQQKIDTSLGKKWSSTFKSVNLEQVDKLYVVKHLGQSRIAGRTTDKVYLKPKDRYRYGLKIQLDHETGIPLQTLLLSESGNLLERHQYVDFSLETPETLNVAHPNCQNITDAKRVEHEDPKWDPRWTPKGFTKIRSDYFLLSGSIKTYSRLYTDGFSSFSIFIEPTSLAREQLPLNSTRLQIGPTTFVSRVGCIDAGPSAIVTVLGELPLVAIEQIALSICPR